MMQCCLWKKKLTKEFNVCARMFDPVLLFRTQFCITSHLYQATTPTRNIAPTARNKLKLAPPKRLPNRKAAILSFGHPGLQVNDVTLSERLVVRRRARS